jgi:DNA-binding GntR family transcriptional regulator
MIDCVNRVDIPSLLDEKYDSYYNIKKVIYADRLPIIFENYYFPTTLYPNLPDMITNNNEVEAIFLDHFKTQEVVAHIQINVIGADDLILALFNTEKGDAMFKFIFFHRFVNSELCFHKISYFPGSRHLIEMKAD